MKILGRAVEFEIRLKGPTVESLAQMQCAANCSHSHTLVRMLSLSDAHTQAHYKRACVLSSRSAAAAAAAVVVKVWQSRCMHTEG